MGSPGNDDSFVSISLDGSECDICLQDTGQSLTTCDVCARFLTDGPVQEGFNELPELIHTDTLAHPSCFRKFHKLARQLSRSSSRHQDQSQIRDTKNTQWLNFNSNNLGNELLLENIHNRVSKSNPGSRSGSPLFAGGSRIGKLKDSERCRSEPRLEASSVHELRRGYTKYLFGKQERDREQNVPKQRLQPVDSIRDESCGGPCKEVPSSKCSSNDNKRYDSHKESSCKLDSSPHKSCQSSNHYQYLTKMHTLSIKDEELDKEYQAAKAEIHNDAKYSRTLTSCHKNKCASKTNIACCHGNQELKMQDRIEKDLPPRDDDNELWRNVKHLNKESLLEMPLPQLISHIQELQCAVNDACSQLVHHLQEKDILSSEVASRHVTIKKLVERQTNLHH